jgi:hypothetical protein
MQNSADQSYATVKAVLEFAFLCYVTTKQSTYHRFTFVTSRRFISSVNNFHQKDKRALCVNFQGHKTVISLP